MLDDGPMKLIFVRKNIFKQNLICCDSNKFKIYYKTFHFLLYIFIALNPTIVRVFVMDLNCTMPIIYVIKGLVKENICLVKTKHLFRHRLKIF